VEAKVREMTEEYQAESGVHDPQLLANIETAIRVSSNTTFRGLLTGKTETVQENTPNGVRYTSYVQMKVPVDQVNKSLNESIRNEEALYNQFKASQAFQKLDNSLIDALSVSKFKQPCFLRRAVFLFDKCAAFGRLTLHN